MNLTARIESYTVGGQVLISESTLAEAGEIVEVGEAIEVKAKGAKEPVRVHPLRGIGGEYNVTLPESADRLTPLEHPLGARYFILEGKQVGDQATEARLTRLSDSGAELLSENSLPPLSNVKLELLAEDGSVVSSEVYAKVMEVRGEDGRTLVLRFTAVPPEAERFLHALLPDAG